MKRSFMILLASMLLVFSLTACGRRDNNAQTSNDPPTTNQEANTGGQSNGGSNAQDDAILGGDDHDIATNPDENSNQNDGILNEPTDNGTSNNDAGVSYERMLRNGRVHDDDGLLNDGENSVSDVVEGTGEAVGDMVRGGKNAVDGMLR